MSTLNIHAPLSGKLIPITEVDDPVFAEKMVGDGMAIEPSDTIVRSPIEGKVTMVFDALHAIGIETAEGIELMIHVGLETVKLKGKGFKVHTKVGKKVKVGSKLLTLDLEYLKTNAKSIITPVVITNPDRVQHFDFSESPTINSKDIMYTITLNNQ